MVTRHGHDLDWLRRAEGRYGSRPAGRGAGRDQPKNDPGPWPRIRPPTSNPGTRMARPLVLPQTRARSRPVIGCRRRHHGAAARGVPTRHRRQSPERGSCSCPTTWSVCAADDVSALIEDPQPRRGPLRTMVATRRTRRLRGTLPNRACDPLGHRCDPSQGPGRGQVCVGPCEAPTIAASQGHAFDTHISGPGYGSGPPIAGSATLIFGLLKERPNLQWRLRQPDDGKQADRAQRF